MAPRKFEPREKDIRRFFAKVEKTSTCWIWTAAKTSHGYGNFYFAGRYIGAHQFAKLLLESPPRGRYEIDHVVCGRRDCVNPAHTEWVPVAGRLNTVRHYATQTRCKHGHEYTPENTYVHRGARSCRKCRRDALARFHGKAA